MSLLGKLFRRALVLLGILIVAAIAVPSFLRARVNSNEAAAIADTRRVQDAEQAYASANGGLFDDVSRLCKEGPDCLGIGIPGYPEDAPEFLDPEIARPSPYFKDGYEREWLPQGRPPVLSEGVSRSSVLDYCYRSTPRGRFTGVRSFSGSGARDIAHDPTGAPLLCPVPLAYRCHCE